MLKCMSHVLKLDDQERIFGYLHMTASDVHALMTKDGVPTSHMKEYMRSKVCQALVKSMLGSILMAVMTKKSKDEEQAYCQFVEDVLNTAFNKSDQNLVLLMCMP
jgi:hypothetical protein